MTSAAGAASPAAGRPRRAPRNGLLRYRDVVQEQQASRYDPGTALVVVDVQNDFADPAGGLAVEGGTDIIPAINDEVGRATDAGALVVYTQDWHPTSTPHFAKDGGIWPVHCVGDTWGAELHPGLRVPDDAPRIRKGTNGEDGYSGFTMRDPRSGDELPTPLHAQLAARSIQRVVVVGLATDYCVQATAIDAARLGYSTTVLADGIAAVDLEAGDGDRAIAAMRSAGVDVTAVEAASR
jgi:nicotinamidase/pyrazinamidase